jgi:diguanylate cyclase (GGDEF)-like protein
MLMNAITLVWVAMFYLFFGDSIGVQHFMYALIIVDLLIIRIHPLFTLLGLYIVRLVLYVTNIYHPMLHETAFSGNMQLFMYLLSLVLECAMVLFNGIYFTKDAFQMESRLQDYNEELRHVASTDPLTQVWNRFRMLEYVDKCLRKCSRGEMDFISVAIGDIDFFKHVNDTYGHECGDEVLKSLAGLFKKEMEGHGAVARWGGEEFLFLFKNMNGDEAMAELSTIQSKLTRMKIPYEDQVLQVTMTFGLTEYDMHLSLDENIKAADDKLYQGKEGGRNRIVY